MKKYYITNEPYVVRSRSGELYTLLGNYDWYVWSTGEIIPDESYAV